jgi:hypothetical protein
MGQKKGLKTTHYHVAVRPHQAFLTFGGAGTPNGTPGLDIILHTIVFLVPIF